MKTKNTARTALLGALFTLLLVPGAFARETLPIDLQTAINKAFATHADIKKQSTAWMRRGRIIMPPGRASGPR